MHPELNATPQNISTPNDASAPSNASQYGFLPNLPPSAELRGSLEDEQSWSSDTGNAASIESSPLQQRIGRLNLRDNHENRPRPSFQQISEYENALAPSPRRKSSEGPAFQVIKKKGNKLDGPQLDNFPNEVLTHILSHLPANSLSAVSLVSRRFYTLVTTPHAWRIAFSRYFPGQDVIESVGLSNRRGSDLEARENIRSERRFFTRLTGLASWRSEYILRTRLLRSLGRGKPAQIAPGHGASSRSNSAANNANAVVTYSSQLFATVNHIHAVFSSGKKSPRFIHGTDETGSACTSDPNIGKIDNWGLGDPQALPQFAELFVGDMPYGLGDGPTGLPNSMDLSQPFGMIYGEGFPGGQTYFRSSEEMRGRFLSQPSDLPAHDLGIPRVPGLSEAISAVWIAKSSSVPTTTDGLVGMLTGSTLGIVTSYSLGADTSFGKRISKGQLTGKWVLSPGVPIIALKVDDFYNSTRKASRRVWAVALNALGEVFCLTKVPKSKLLDPKSEERSLDQLAWRAGRTAYWQLVEPSRRVAKDDPYHESEIHGSYSPRSSSRKMRLSKVQIMAETLEIEKFLGYQPSHFRQICDGWDMRRRLEVDFGGDDGHGAGEGIVVMRCGIEDGQSAEIKRFTRWKSEQASLNEYPVPKTPPPPAPVKMTMASLFGGGTTISPPRNASPDRSPRRPTMTESVVTTPGRAASPESSASTPMSPASVAGSMMSEEWRVSILSLKDHPLVEITTSAIDMSTFATSTLDEDPLWTVNGSSGGSTPFATPSDQESSSGAQIPGHRARFLAIGTKNGAVIMWNMRGPQASTAGLVNDVVPLRTIVTDSPQISCLAVSALYVVHGGNDGLVQAWDPLASSLQPIRTLNSRFSSRARRRLVQAEASIHGVGINLYAAGAIAIDPDSTVLRGMVSLGTHLRYWSYSSSAADQYQSKKRRLRRSGERGSNGAPDRFTNTGRGALMDYIATEQEELKKEKLHRSREQARLHARFGVGLGGLTEEEAIRYAEMVSAEAFQKDEERRMSDTGYLGDANESSSAQSVCSSSSATVTPEGSVKGRASSPPKYKPDVEFEQDIEMAIRLSLMDGIDEGGRSPRASGSGQYDIPITFKQKKSFRSPSVSPSSSKASKNRLKVKDSASHSTAVAADDLDFALQLSLAEEQSRREAATSGQTGDEYPALESREISGKGKGRAD